MQTFISGELIPSGVEDFDRKLADEALYLPKDSWTCLRKSESGNAVVETGWLVQPDQAIVSICEVGSFGDLKVNRSILGVPLFEIRTLQKWEMLLEIFSCYREN